jgi:hypothetical protein
MDLLRGRGRAEPAPAEGHHLARRGRTPVIAVSGKGSGRVSVAGLVCLQPGARGHLYYRVRVHRAARASAAACPKPITPNWSPPRTTS